MSDLKNTDNSIANGIPARHIGPETGSSGDATMSNKAGTSEGSNEASDSTPPPAAGLEAPILTGARHKEEQSFGVRPHPHPESAAPFDPDVDSAVQQVADGGDRIKHDDHEDHHRR